MPKNFQFKSNAKPSIFEYPELLKQKDLIAKEKAQTVALSITAKAKARAVKKGQDKGKMDIEENENQEKKKENLMEEEKKQKEEKNVEKNEKEKEKEEEPRFNILKNPSRILPKQENLISFIDNRYEPIITVRFCLYD